VLVTALEPAEAPSPPRGLDLANASFEGMIACYAVALRLADERDHAELLMRFVVELTEAARLRAERFAFDAVSRRLVPLLEPGWHAETAWRVASKEPS
jgi:hypothetical protein